jgi:hypothetical protein
VVWDLLSSCSSSLGTVSPRLSHSSVVYISTPYPPSATVKQLLHPTVKAQPYSAITINMTSSKFVEILDNRLPYSHDNVSLEDTLAETGQRSTSNSSESTPSPTRDRSPTSSPSQPVKTRLRAFSLKKSKT